jgi:hypothetical protein
VLAFAPATKQVFLLGLLVVGAFIALAEAFARIAHTSLLNSIVIGKDNRTSTSKVFVLMWTLLVAWALASLFIAGEVASQRPCTQAINVKTQQNDLNAAATQCQQAQDHLGLVQVGWMRFVEAGLDGGYLILLGLPAGSAILSKAITTSKVDSGATTKVSAPQAGQTLATRVTQIFSSDDGSTDLADFQYMFFNVLAGGYFVGHILRVMGQGLPHIPDTLLGLTSVSAALYVGNKAASRSKPTILSVFPSILTTREPFTVTGTNLTADPSVPPAQQPAGLIAPDISINGVRALDVKPDPAVADRLTAVVPPGLIPSGATSPIPGTLDVLTAFGVTAPSYSVQVQ